MRHRVKKIKFKGGRDANKILLRKLACNFLIKGKLTTTLAKAKVLKSYLEKLLEKSKTKTEANKNFLIRKLGQKKIVAMLFDQIGPAIKEKIGGYVRLIKLTQRAGDGADMGQLEWVYPVILETKSKAKK